MSGETEQDVSGWTVDTLHSHVQVQIADLRQFMERRMDDQREMLDERYATSVKALDAAFLAQQTAMRTALEAAEKAVATALSSAEKAVAKAEASSDKRFDSVNEFRQQLNDQAQTFLSRGEADVRLAAISEKVDLLVDRNNDRAAEMSKRMDLTQGKAAGMNASWVFLVGAISLILAILGIVAFFNARV